MYIVCADLCGPAGTQNTGVAVFAATDKCLDFVDRESDGSDDTLLDMINLLANEAPVTVGLDAPLSYEPGGGDRGRDAELRRVIVAKGMRPGSVMAPLASRMVYVTLRGVVLSRALSFLNTENSVSIVEVHPGAALCLRDAPIEAILAFAKDPISRADLVDWMAKRGVRGLRVPSPCPSHFVAACAGGIAAWDWYRGRSPWVARAELPWHPFDFAA